MTIRPIILPQKVYFKSGCLGVALRELGEVYFCKSALLVNDGDAPQTELEDAVKTWMRKQKILYSSYEKLDAGVEAFQAKVDDVNPDVIIGIGSDAALNAAKVLHSLKKDAKLVLVAGALGKGGQNNCVAVADGVASRSRDYLADIAVTDPHYGKGATPEEVEQAVSNVVRMALSAYTADENNWYIEGYVSESISKAIAVKDAAKAGRPEAIESLMNACGLAAIAYGNMVDDPEAYASYKAPAADDLAYLANIAKMDAKDIIVAL